LNCIPADAAIYLVKPSVDKSNSFHQFFSEKAKSERAIRHSINSISAYSVDLGDADLAEFKKRVGVEYIEANSTYHTMAIPSNQWGLGVASKFGVDAMKAWKITKGVKEVKVSVIDTGIDCSHPALKGHCDQGWDFVNNVKDGLDSHGHGTHCAGNIAANSSSAMGIAPNVTVLAAKFLDANGSGTLEGALLAIEYSINQGAQILSNSWGGGSFDQSLYDIIAIARDKGILFIAASGNETNDNSATPSYPASYELDNIISVAAIDNKGALAYFSNWGLTNVHLGAPGVSIYSTVLNGGYGSMSGTSMATPFVAGIAALVKSAHPEYSYSEIKDKIMNGAVALPSLDGKTISGGTANAFNSLK
jgi:thermitase